VTDLITFLRARLQEDEDTAQAAARAAENGYNSEPPWEFDGDEMVSADGRGILTGPWGIEHEIARHVERFQPARVLREVEAKRRVMERHCLSDATKFTAYCAGGHYDSDGYPEVELQDCPELQDMAFIWNDHEDWSNAWCPHVEGRHRAAVTNSRAAEGTWTNECNRCGEGDGWRT
jgi:hypothetical protein